MNSHNNYTIADTVAPISLFGKNGYYVVGNKIFNYKIHALQEASRTGLPVHWNFNDEVFNNFDWAKRLNVSLLEMYRLRAQQLRQKYKWLVVCWSGGGDSTTMLESFLDNNIHIDELLILWPVSKSVGKYQPSLDTNNSNFMSEWDYSIRPRLDKLRAQYPKLNITIRDTFEDPPLDEDREDTMLIVEKHSYGTIQKWRELDYVLKERVEKHDSVAAILGVSPVEVAILHNTVLAVYFNESPAYPGSKSDITLEGWPRNIEFFYWTPDMPELIREQAHAVLDRINVSPQTRSLLHQYKINSAGILEKWYEPDPEIVRQFKKSVLYPNYPLDTFQARKQDDTHDRASWENWFHTNPHAEEFLAPWESAVKAQQRMIKDDFFVKKNGKIVSYKPFHTKFKIVGKLVDSDLVTDRASIKFM